MQNRNQEPGDVRERVRHLLRGQRLAVLATQSDGAPYASLVAFAATDDLKGLVFATTRATRKYANLMQQPMAAMLIDNRLNRPRDFHEAVALTALGRVEETGERERAALVGALVGRHPHLGDFAASPSSAVLVLRVASYRFVERFQNVVEWKVTP